MNCPVCPSLLMELRVGPVELDECPRCLGMWFDQGELKTFLGARLEARELPQRFVPKDASGPTGTSACPRCVTTRLRRITQYGHPVSGCERCGGVWATAALVSSLLDHGSTADAQEETGDETTPAADSGHASARPPPAAAPAAIAGAAAAAVDEAAPEQPRPRPPINTARKTIELKGGCTACGAKMEPVTHEGQAFHRCVECGALFFQRGGLPFFLRKGVKTWQPPPAGGPEPGAERRCPSCSYAMEPVTLSGHPARLWACSDCWSMFASAGGVRRLVNPDENDEALSGSALGLWRVLDAFTEWLVTPPKTARYSAHRPRR